MLAPAAVRKGIDAANALIKTQASPPSPAAATPAPQPAPAPGAQSAEDVTKLKADLAKANADLAEANRKITSYRGRENAELRELDAKVKELSEKLTAAEAKEKAKLESGEVSSLTEDERATAGKDLLDVIVKTATEIADRRVSAALKPHEERVGKMIQQTEAVYFATLDRLVPTWEKVNEEPEFARWLQEIDPTSQRQRLHLVKGYEAARQGYDVAEVFLAYMEKREIGARAQSPQPKDPQPPLNPGPGNGGDVLPADESGKRTWTNSQIAKFYADKRTGLYKGKAEEARILEEDILAASREGRVRPG